jgi:hypothetical protein
MFETIRKVKKPCIAFKILSGGHLCNNPEQLEAAFREAYSNIKPDDMAVVGVFQKYTDQLTQNADIVKRIFNNL